MLLNQLAVGTHAHSVLHVSGFMPGALGVSFPAHVGWRVSKHGIVLL